MITVQDLTVRFGTATVLEGLSFELPAGGSLALWGENGAGKTTAIRAMLGLLPFTGQVTIAGQSMPKQGRAARAALGYVPQQLAFYDDMRVDAALRYFAALRRAPKAQPAALLARVGLADHAAKPVGALSGGMRQRLALAVALLGDPPLLVLDEPTASLDTEARADFMQLLAEQRAAGRSLLLTSHRVEEVTRLADTVIVLAGGRERLRCPAELLERALRPESVLRIALAPEGLEAAIAGLAAGGFEARRNGHGVRVRVTTGERGAPLASLTRAEIPFHDLSLEEQPWTPE